MIPFQYETFGLNAHWFPKVIPLDRVHHHPEVEITYIKTGKVHYLFRWKKVSLSAGRFYLFWGSTPHRLIRGDDKTQFGWVTVPLPLIRQWNLSAPFFQKLMTGDILAESGSTPLSERYSLASWVTEIEGRKEKHSIPLQLELAAFFHRFAESFKAKVPTARPSKDPRFENHIEKMAQFMGQNFQEQIQVKEVALHAGIHPKYAIRYFHRHCGITPHQYLLQFRINHAQQLLISTAKKVIDISAESGFKSLSAFYSIFEKSTGYSPLQFKKQFATHQN